MKESGTVQTKFNWLNWWALLNLVMSFWGTQKPRIFFIQWMTIIYSRKSIKVKGTRHCPCACHKGIWLSTHINLAPHILPSALHGDECSALGPSHFIPSKRAPIPTIKKTWWAPEMGWTLKNSLLFLPGNQMIPEVSRPWPSHCTDYASLALYV